VEGLGSVAAADGDLCAGREQQILARYASSLATLLAEESLAGPDELTPSVVANTLIGFHRAFLDHVRQRIGKDPADLRRLARTVQADGQQALEFLAAGLAGYGVRPVPVTTKRSNMSP
jgi:hypothetical protein